MKRLPIRNSGQALLVILLIMAVALTIGLAVTSRTVTDVEISGKTEEAARAFSAAEAGIEEALVGIGTGTFTNPPDFGEGVSYTSEKSDLGVGTEFVFPEVAVGEIKTLYLANYGTGGTLTPSYAGGSIDLCWENVEAAIEATLYYDSGGYKVARYAVDAKVDRDPDNYFEEPDSGGCAGLTYKKTLVFPDGVIPLFLRVRVLYVSTRVGVSAAAGSALPAQGVKIVSTGLAGTSTRKVEVIRMHPAPPGIFDFLLYSESDLKHE